MNTHVEARFRELEGEVEALKQTIARLVTAVESSNQLDEYEAEYILEPVRITRLDAQDI